MFVLTLLLIGLLHNSAQLPYSQLLEKSQQGKQALEQGRFDEAASIYAELVRALPGNAGLRMNLGLALSMTGRRREAIAHFEKALKLQPDLVEAWVLVGAARLELGEHQNAVEPLQKALALQPANLQGRQMLAEALLALGRYRDASEQLRELARLNRQDPKAWYGLGRAYENLSQQAFEELGKVAAESPYWLVLVGEALARQEKYSNAFFFLRRALEKSDRLRGVHRAIADIYRATDHPGWATIEEEKERTIPEPDCATHKLECAYQAQRYLQVANLARDRRNAETLYWLARAYNRLALEAFSRLGELPPSPEFHKLKAGVLIGRRQYREAADLLREAARLSPKDFEAKKQLAETLYQSRDFEAARVLLKELLQLEGSRPELSFLYGDTLLQLQQGEDAIAHLKKAVVHDEQLLSAHAALARAYLQVGKTHEAIPHLERALKTDQDGTLHYQLVRAYQSVGKTDLARQMLERYQEIRKSVQSETQKLQEEIRITPP